MSFSQTDEQYARSRISESPLSSLLALKIQPQKETSMAALDLQTDRNIKTVVAELFLMTVQDTVVPLNKIADAIKEHTNAILTMGIGYAQLIIAEAEEEFKEEEEEKEDWQGEDREKEDSLESEETEEPE